MTCELIPVELTDTQQAQVCGILSVGCDRQTAANFIGCSLADIRRAMNRDASFLASVCRAEAGAELTHMQAVKEAAKDVRNWRASTWWLERRSPERFGRRSAGVVTTRQLQAYTTLLVNVVGEFVREPGERQMLAARLRSISRSVDQMLRDGGTSPIEVGDESM